MTSEPWRIGVGFEASTAPGHRDHPAEPVRGNMQTDQEPGQGRTSKRAHLDRNPLCPLLDEEIAYWAPRLGPPRSTHPNVRTARERRLRSVITDWFDRASNLLRVRRLPSNWPHAPVRVDEALPEIADRLEAIRNEILALPGAVTTMLRVRFANYDLALTALGALPIMLDEIAAGWHRPHSGQPNFRMAGEVIGLLITGVERFTGEKLPSPRSKKRQTEFDFVRLLTARLLPELSDANVRTALRHWYKSRRAAIL